MEKENFPALVRKYFGYLEDQYRFSVVKEETYAPDPISDGFVEFQSNTTILTIRADRGDVLISVWPSSEPEVSKLSLDVISDFRTDGRITQLIHFPKAPSRIEARVEHQLETYAYYLRKYAAPLLKGDFSWWLDACKYFLRKMRETYRSLTGEEYPEDDPFIEYVKSKENPSEPG